MEHYELKSNSLTNQALRRFKKNLWGVLSFWFISISCLVGIFAYLIAPDNSQNANQMHISIHSKAPGFEVKMLTVPSTTIVQEQSWWQQLFFGVKNTATEIPIATYQFTDSDIVITPYTEGELPELSRKINLAVYGDISKKEIENNYIDDRHFMLGTDKYGRDLLSRMLVGIRVSISIGFIAVLISLLLGISLGAIAGYFGGLADKIIMWLINVTWSIPTLLMVIAITVALNKGFWQVFVAVGLTMWVEVARVVRGQVLGIKEQQYVTAAKALGYSHFRILTRHVLPNSLAPVIVISAANFAAAILIESGLSFLGIGAQPPTPSWGAMIKDHYAYIVLGKAYLAIIPGLAIMSLVLAFMLIGNALRDALDVKS
ncbi:ABC transporter permease [Aquimarina brevivitae]|uniref:Peptide/nickel transport system permease protein n=1 Tax=Aquimarina brevivitae TaxID=323412 RepID=A0A4Q7PGF2_9FLAO|nr:ABC transporter permease [Aquimarina brevivitae]RZS98958.1 peptide/nickel transport system permease protein [Aquimarina brevivitae]